MKFKESKLTEMCAVAKDINAILMEKCDSPLEQVNSVIMWLAWMTLEQDEPVASLGQVMLTYHSLYDYLSTIKKIQKDSGNDT